MQIFIDTNIIIQENFFRSTNALAFLKAARFLGFDIVIPEIVIDEVKANFSVTLAKNLTPYNKAQKIIASLTGVDQIDISLDDEKEKYIKWLDDILEQYGVEILPYPQLPLKEIVTESYKAQKPFKKDGEGHKDYLIWKTISLYINDQGNDVENCFLTDNVHDFCEKQENDWVLHSYLANQIQADRSKPKVYRNFKEIFEQKIDSSLQGVEISDIPELSLSDLKTKAQEILEKDLQLYSAYGFEGLSFENDVTIDCVHDVNIGGWDLKEVDRDEVLITISGSVLIEVDGFIDKHDSYSMDGVDSKVHVIDSNWNDWVMAVTSTIRTPFELTLSYSKEENTITGHTVNLIEETSIYDY